MFIFCADTQTHRQTQTPLNTIPASPASANKTNTNDSATTASDIRTGVTEAAGPAVQTHPRAVVGADVVAELVATGIARQRTATSIVAGVAE